jgi:VWFA-related protein
LLLPESRRSSDRQVLTVNHRIGLRFATTVAVVLSAMTAGRAGLPLSPGLGVQAPAQPTFSARSELVVLHVMVKDRRGAYVPGLGPEAFTVFEDDRPQAIRFFAIQDAPVTVGLIIDSSGSMLPVRDRVITAAGLFAATSNPDDEIFALAFNEVVRAALPPEAPFTGDAETLRMALTRTISARGRTALYDAMLAGLKYVDRGNHSRKVLVVLSDGGDNASSATLEQALQQTQVANTVIYTIALLDLLERDANPRRLKQFADASGGEAFRPRNVAQIGEILEHIARDIRNAYTIGYVPGARDGRFRRIRVVVSVPGGPALSVRTRQGYLMGEK